MMFFHGCAFATSPQGASQTIFSPGMSGVPEPRASVARSVCAAAGNTKVAARSASLGRRNCMNFKIQWRTCLARFESSGVLAQNLGGRIGLDSGDQRGRGIVGGKAV